MKITPSILSYNFAEVKDRTSNVTRVHYEDLAGIQYLSNWDIARIINTVKENLNKGIEVKFINVKDELRQQMKNIDSDNILNIA